MTNDKSQMEVCLRHIIINNLFLHLSFLIFNLSFFFILPALAQEIPVNVKADKLRYVEGTGIFEAYGSAEVQFENVTIQADFLRMDPVTNITTAEGRVKLFSTNYSADSDYIIYDATREVSTFKNFRSQLSPKKVKGHVYLSVKKLVDLQHKMLGADGSITTCGNELPHYFAMADRIEYYPEDKIIGYNVTLYVGKMPVLWLPYMFYSLSGRQERNWFFGHNAVEGDYVKSSWGYPGGILYLDEMQKKGFGYGIATNYGLLGLGLGSLYVYHLDEQDTGISDWITRINHTKQINPSTTLKLGHSYTATYLIPSGRKDQTAFNLDLNHKSKARWDIHVDSLDDRMASLQKYAFRFNQSHKKISTNYYFNYDFSKKDPKWLRSSQRLYHRRPLPLWSDKITFATLVNYYNSVASSGAPGNERLEPMIEISGKEPLFSWHYTENRYFDLDGDAYTGDESYQYLEKRPEIEINSKVLNLGLFNLKPTFGYGYYHEVHYVSGLGRNRDYATQRYRATLNACRRIPLALGTVAVVGGGLDQFLYAPGDQLFAYRESLSLKTKLFGAFKNDINARKGQSEGNTPFLFDRLGTRYHDFSERMTFYYKNKFNWSTSSGYNWQTHQWIDVMTKLLMKPRDGVFWNIKTGWDIENTRYKDLINTLRLNPYNFLSMSFSTTSDMNEGQLRYGSVLYDIYFLKGESNQWRLKFSQIFESASQQFKLRDIMIVKDLHCWELKYTYSDYRKEFSLTFSLKALPDQPVGYSSGKGLHFDGFERELKKIMQEVKQEGGAVKRY